MISLRELRAQVKGDAICTECLITDACVEQYPKVGCPALRFLRRIAEDGC